MSTTDKLLGMAKAINYAPKGEVAGLILVADGETVQVNFPPDWADLAPTVLGQTIELEVAPEPKVADHPEGDHRVYCLVAIKGESAGRPGGHRPPTPAASGAVEGVAASLNYAKHGEANGVLLDTGDFVHLKPGGMKRSGLELGQRVVARGEARTFGAGRTAIDARSVNGIDLDPKKAR